MRRTAQGTGISRGLWGGCATRLGLFNCFSYAKTEQTLTFVVVLHAAGGCSCLAVSLVLLVKMWQNGTVKFGGRLLMSDRTYESIQNLGPYIAVITALIGAISLFL